MSSKFPPIMTPFRPASTEAAHVVMSALGQHATAPQAGGPIVSVASTAPASSAFGGASENLIQIPGKVVGPFQVDIAERLPEKPRALLFDYRDRCANAHAAVVDATSKRETLRTKKQKLEQRDRTLQDDHRFYNDEHPSVRQVKHDIATTEAEWDRQNVRYERVAEEWRHFASIVDRAERWLELIPADRPLQLFALNELVPKKGETAATAIEQRRRRVRELKAQIKAIIAAPRDPDWAKARARADVEALASAGRPDCYNLVEYGESVRWPRVEFSLLDMNRMTLSGKVRDGVALLAFLMKDQIVAALDAEIDRLADDSGLSDEARAAKLAEARADLLAVEREEEALRQRYEPTMKAREGVDFRALFGLADDLPARAED